MPKGKETPVVRTRSRGQVSSVLHRYADEYREKHPGREVRYVYDPVHKPELSGVLGRQAMGYEKVTLGDIGMASTSDEEVKPVRVGDLILMSVDKETRDEAKKELRDRATEQRLSVDRSYRDAIDQAAEDAGAQKLGHSREPMRPIGRASIDEREKEYEFEQRTKEE